jgi:hypothetical protein
LEVGVHHTEWRHLDRYSGRSDSSVRYVGESDFRVTSSEVEELAVERQGVAASLTTAAGVSAAAISK